MRSTFSDQARLDVPAKTKLISAQTVLTISTVLNPNLLFREFLKSVPGSFVP